MQRMLKILRAKSDIRFRAKRQCSVRYHINVKCSAVKAGMERIKNEESLLCKLYFKLYNMKTYEEQEQSSDRH